MKTFKYFKEASDDKNKVYRHSNYLQSRDTAWIDRNSQSEDIRDDTEDDLHEPIEEDIRD